MREGCPSPTLLSVGLVLLHESVAAEECHAVLPFSESGILESLVSVEDSLLVVLCYDGALWNPCAEEVHETVLACGDFFELNLVENLSERRSYHKKRLDRDAVGLKGETKKRVCLVLTIQR